MTDDDVADLMLLKVRTGTRWHIRRDSHYLLPSGTLTMCGRVIPSDCLYWQGSESLVTAGTTCLTCVRSLEADSYPVGNAS